MGKQRRQRTIVIQHHLGHHHENPGNWENGIQTRMFAIQKNGHYIINDQAPIQSRPGKKQGQVKGKTTTVKG